MAEANLRAIISIAGMPIKEDVVLNSLSVTENGSYTPDEGVDGFSEVTVDVQPILTDLSVTENGEYEPTEYGFNKVTVDVQPKLVNLHITENGTYTPEDAYGFNEVTTDINIGYTIEDVINRNYGDSIGSEEVTGLEEYNFYYSKIKSIDFPNVTHVDTGSLYHCDLLEYANLPSLEKIAKEGMAYTFNLRELNAPNLNRIEESGLEQCGLIEAMFPNVTTIGRNSFTHCIHLVKVDLRSYKGTTNTTTSATLANAFEGCPEIKYVALQNLVNGFKQTNLLYQLFNSNSLTNVTTCYMIFDMETPPVLAALNAISSTESVRRKIKICVPQSSLSAWQNATNWASMNIVSIESMGDELKGQFDWLDEKYWSTT